MFVCPLRLIIGQKPVIPSTFIICSFGGKVKEKLVVAADADRQELEKIALENDRIKHLLDGKTVVKVVAVPGRLINIVVR